MTVMTTAQASALLSTINTNAKAHALVMHSLAVAKSVRGRLADNLVVFTRGSLDVVEFEARKRVAKFKIEELDNTITSLETELAIVTSLIDTYTAV